MIRSIRYFLLISLLLSITIASAINGIGNYLLDEKVIQPYLDSQLLRIASMIRILNNAATSNPGIKKHFLELIQHSEPINRKQLVFEIWDSNNNLVIHSLHTPKVFLRNMPSGFSDKIIDGNDWRIYSETDPVNHSKLIVAELYNLRRELTDDIARSNANILLITYPVFGLLVWFIISFALRSITKVTTEISNRASTYLEPVQLTQIPLEIKPLVAELNKLFIRLKLAFERNKRFAADAAHELRTPLAALKTHLQVALKTDDKTDQEKAFQKVLESVDRSSHVVAQLLTLSRLGEEEALTDVKPFNLHRLATEILAYLASHAIEKNIDIELAPSPQDEPVILGNDTAVGILIRNIVDNAIRYTPRDGEVKISIIDTGTQIIFRVCDNGSGIPAELRERVFERFYRILGTKASGSGLGLAIVSQIAALHHAHIHLATPPTGVGLQFDVAFPKYRA